MTVHAKGLGIPLTFYFTVSLYSSSSLASGSAGVIFTDVLSAVAMTPSLFGESEKFFIY